MIEVVSNGIYPKQCICERCQAVLSYCGADVQRGNDYRRDPKLGTIAFISKESIECPHCGHEIILTYRYWRKQ